MQYWPPSKCSAVNAHAAHVIPTFCNFIFSQEADYFRRVVARLKNRAVVLDHPHGRVWNPVLSVDDFIIPSTGVESDDHMASRKFHSHSLSVFHYKWGHDAKQDWWETNPPINVDCRHKEFCYYPYFEKVVNQELYIV